MALICLCWIKIKLLVNQQTEPTVGPWLSLQVRGQDQGCGPPPFPTRTQRLTPTARLTCISCQQRKEETTKGVGTVKVTLFITLSLTPPQPPYPPKPLL